MAPKKWLHSFTKRYRMSLKRRTNKKRVDAQARIPVLRRWFARLARRAGRKSTLNPENKTPPRSSAGLNHREKALDGIISIQGRSFEQSDPSALWSRDCGLGAIRNVTVDETLTLDALLQSIRPKQQQHENLVSTADLNYLTEGKGDFNGVGMAEYLQENAYECVLGRNHTDELLELLCLTFKRRVFGVVWHVGANRSSHWLCASYEHSEVPFNQRSWFKKDSI